MLLNGLVHYKYWQKNIRNLNDLQIIVFIAIVQLVIVRKFARKLNCWTDNNINHYNVIDHHLHKAENSNYMYFLPYANVWTNYLISPECVSIERDGKWKRGRQLDSVGMSPPMSQVGMSDRWTTYCTRVTSINTCTA